MNTPFLNGRDAVTVKPLECGRRTTRTVFLFLLLVLLAGCSSHDPIPDPFVACCEDRTCALESREQYCECFGCPDDEDEGDDIVFLDDTANDKCDCDTNDKLRDACDLRGGDCRDVGCEPTETIQLNGDKTCGKQCQDGTVVMVRVKGCGV